MARRYSSIVIRLVDKEDDGDETKSGHEGVEGKSPLPFLGTDNEGREKWAKIRRKNDESCPDVDLPRMFVKEEHILDPHEPTLLLDQYFVHPDTESRERDLPLLRRWRKTH